MAPPDLKLVDFDYAHPEDLVAQTPAADRDGARLLVRDAAGTVRHRIILDLVDELPAGALLVFNDSRVFPSRLRARLPTGGQVELFLLGAVSGGAWTTLARPMKKLKTGLILALGDGMTATVEERDADEVRVRFSAADERVLFDWLDRNGIIPLPPYIKRPDPVAAPHSPDRERYQTVYARERGSVAAPTAGLHFSERLLGRLQEKGVETAFVSLHVGAGTFLPVKSDEPAAHKMHSEPFIVSSGTVRAICAARREGRPVFAVGTTSFRTLEQLGGLAGSDDERRLLAFADQWHATELFIYPKTEDDRYRPRLVDGLFTNFHQPKSTLFMLICALIGFRNAHANYREAVGQRYRLFSYGDACLLWLKESN